MNMTMIFILLFLCSTALSNAFTLKPHCSTIVRRQWTFAKSNNFDDDDDDFDVPDVDTNNFKPPKSTFGLRGRSAPSQRKAMGTSGSGSTSVHVCTNCGAEFVKWMGRCPTCREWNTLQEFRVDRGSVGGGGGGANFGQPSFASSANRPKSWLDGSSDNLSTDSDIFYNQPVRVTDIYREIPTAEKDNVDFSQHGPRIQVPNDSEFNNVLGGGIMKGSITLLGGDPGVGKSTLLLQTAGSIATLSTPTRGIGMGSTKEDISTGKTLGPVWYVSGEENADQVASRAMRLGIFETELWLLSETHVDTLADQVVSSYQKPRTTQDGEEIPGSKPNPPALLVIDSIQTMVCEAGGSSSAGGITQVRECVALLLRLAKSTGIPIFLIGHVTKNGDVAGPRTVEHMVDAVLYLEGSNTVGGAHLRMLRASKNRFGPSDEVGVYEMSTGRLCPISDPSSLFLSARLDYQDSEGCATSLVLEGSRAMTVEVQALVATSAGGNGYGRRTVGGISFQRLSLLLGVLQKRCGMFFAKQDVYVNVVGGIQLHRGEQEGSSSDLATAVALVSSIASIPVRSDTAFVGEVGLLGELRTVSMIEKRLKEATRMGFSRIVTPRFRQTKGTKKKKVNNSSSATFGVRGVEWIECDTLMEAINAGLISELPKRKNRKSRKESPGACSSEYQSLSPGRLEDLMLGDTIDDGDEEDETVFE